MLTTARLLYAIIILLLLTSATQAQYYEQAVGLRLGYSSGVSYKVFFEEDRGVELTLTGRDRSILAGGLLVHHTGKVSTDNAGTINVYDTIRGSSAIRATCRGTLILAADERNYRLHVENGWGKHDLQILLDHHPLNWRLMGNWVAPNVDLSQKARVLNYMSQVGKATIDDISEGTQLPKRSLYEVLKRLQSDEMLEKHGNRQSAVYVRTSIQQIEQFNSLLTENAHPPFKSDQLELKDAETVDTQASQPQRNSDIAPNQQLQHVESLKKRQEVDRATGVQTCALSPTFSVYFTPYSTN